MLFIYLDIMLLTIYATSCSYDLGAIRDKSRISDGRSGDSVKTKDGSVNGEQSDKVNKNDSSIDGGTYSDNESGYAGRAAGTDGSAKKEAIVDGGGAGKGGGIVEAGRSGETGGAIGSDAAGNVSGSGGSTNGSSGIGGYAGNGGYGGTTTSVECTTNQTKCADSTRISTCNDQGKWNSPTDCDYVCVGDLCGGECKPNATKCKNNKKLQTCNSDGKWNDGVTCNGQTCVDGACVDS